MESLKRIIIRKEENIIKSIISDTYTFVCQIGVIGVGVYCESTMMQWLGLITLCLFLTGRTMSIKKYTIEEAIAELEKMKCEKLH